MALDLDARTSLGSPGRGGTRMRTRLRGRFTSAHAIALLALFVALGGSSYAALKLGKGVVKGRHIAADAVTSPKVKDRSLLAKDFKSGQLPKGAPGAAGRDGAP